MKPFWTKEIHDAFYEQNFTYTLELQEEMIRKMKEKINDREFDPVQEFLKKLDTIKPIKEKKKRRRNKK